MEILSLLALAGGSGGGTGGSQLVGYVTKGSTFPTRRLDGSPLEVEDYVKVDGITPQEDFPFIISGVTFTNRKDMGIYLGNNRWTLDAGLIQFTTETPTTNRDAESLNGKGTTQAQVNLQVANAIGRKKEIAVYNKDNIIDAINYIWVECKKAGYIFSLTETDTNSIRDIVINIKDKDNNVLLDKTLSDFILKTRKVAGYDLADDITDQEIQDAIKELRATLKNKTMSADDNTFTDFTPNEFKASAKKEGSANNDKFTTQGYVDDEIAKVVATTYSFKGFISTNQPVKAKVGSLWYESATLPTTFPINVKNYDGTTWSATTSEYTPDDLDLWSLVADKHGYYWFSEEWNILDTSQANPDNTTIQRNNQDELEVKDGGITNDKLASDIKVGSLTNLLTTAKDSVVNAINELFNNKQDKITDSTNQNNPIDTDTLSNVSAISKTNTTWTFAQVWNWVTNKLVSAITSESTNNQIASAKATKNYVDDKIRYVHTIIRYNNDSKEYPMGWFKFINTKSSITIDDVKQFLKDGEYNSTAKAYHWCGGCCGTTGVRNSADTGTAYIGRVVSGVFYVESEDSMYFKYDYNGTVTILYSRINIISEQI